MKESYLITGATGFVGACLTQKLVKLGKTVHIISRKPQVNWRLKNIETQINFHTIDLRDKNLSLLLHTITPTYVFHLAAYGSLPKEDKIDEMITTNLLGTINLLQSLNFKTLKLFINTGSSAEYEITNKPFKENDPLQPMNNYAVSKVAQTLFCQKEALQNKLPIITFRLFSPFGYFEESTRLIPYGITHALNNTAIPLSNKTFVRDFIFIEDVVAAYLQAGKSVITPGEIFNIGSGEQYTIEDIINKILHLALSSSQPQWGKREKQSRQIEPKIWKADITKAKNLLHWEPKYTIDTGLKKTINWFKTNKNFYD